MPQGQKVKNDNSLKMCRMRGKDTDYELWKQNDRLIKVKKDYDAVYQTRRIYVRMDISVCIRAAMIC